MLNGEGSAAEIESARAANGSCGDLQLIIRALQLAFIILAIAVIYPFAGREPVLFPKDTTTPDGVARTQIQKSDRLIQAKKLEEEAIPPEQSRSDERGRPFFQNRPADSASPKLDMAYL